jgi:hypothetical protein
MHTRGPRPTSGRRAEATIWALYRSDTSPEIQLARPANAPSRGEGGRGPAGFALDSGQKGAGRSGSALGSKPTFAALALKSVLIRKMSGGYADGAAGQIRHDRGWRPTSGGRAGAPNWAFNCSDASPELHVARPATHPPAGRLPLSDCMQRLVGHRGAARRLHALIPGKRGRGDEGPPRTRSHSSLRSCPNDRFGH